jgi:hypothetical protein
MTSSQQQPDLLDLPPEAASGINPEMECSIYQNYSASEVFVQGMAGVVNQQGRRRNSPTPLSTYF